MAATATTAEASASKPSKSSAQMLSPSLPPPPPPPVAPVMPATASQIEQASASASASAATSSTAIDASSEAMPPSIEEIFSPDGKVNMRLLMMSLWKHRKDQSFTSHLCARLANLTTISSPTLDEIEFYLPQLAHMVIHLEQELPIEDMEQFVLLLSQSSVHFALQLFWIIYAALDENRPKRGGNPRTFARCAQLLLALEQCLVYGSPSARELSELLTRNSISKAEMDQILMADRRFFAAQSRAQQSSMDLTATAEGWLYKKGGGTSKMGRRNWKLRWCRIEKRVLLVFSSPADVHPRTAVPLDRAEVRVVENPKHPFFFELVHEFSETKMKFAAQSQEELLNWVQQLHKAASPPEPPATASISHSRAGSTNANHSLARMSMAMRSFILESGGGVDAPRSGSPLKTDFAPSVSLSPSSPPKSPRGQHHTTSCPFGTTDAWSESQRRTVAQTSVSATSAHSSDASDLSSMVTETLILQAQPPLPFDQQKRYEFFTGMITFVKAITDVSESLRRVEPPKRKSLLRPRLEQLHVPANAYIPLCKSTDVYCHVRGVFTSEGRVFNTNERAPCLLYFDTEENELARDVSQVLFDQLYAEDGNEDENGDGDRDPAMAVTNLEDDAFLTTKPKPTAGVKSASATTTGNKSAGVPSAFLQQVLEDPERKQQIEKIFGELSFSVAARLQGETVCEDPSRWRLSSLIAKSYDDLRQEVLVMQLISYFDHIFRLEGLPLRLYPYRILSTGASTGLIEVVRNATSLDCIKKTPGFKNLRDHFERLYGDASNKDGESELLRQAEFNFVHSLAAYSLVCNMLLIKDRHNGNIMLDVEGHLIHIDFGFFLGRAPGGSFSFETAPFKLTAEMVDVLGGRQSANFKYYCDLCVKGAIAVRKHADTIYTLVEVMSFHSKLPCFAGNASATAATLTGLRERLFLTTSPEKIESLVLQKIERSYDHFGTTKYDQFQVYSNGIAK